MTSLRPRAASSGQVMGEKQSVKKGEIDKAIALYEKRVHFDPYSYDRRLIHLLSYYELAKLYEEQGNNAKSNFNGVWKCLKTM